MNTYSCLPTNPQKLVTVVDILLLIEMIEAGALRTAVGSFHVVCVFGRCFGDIPVVFLWSVDICRLVRCLSACAILIRSAEIVCFWYLGCMMWHDSACSGWCHTYSYSGARSHVMFLCKYCACRDINCAGFDYVKCSGVILFTCSWVLVINVIFLEYCVLRYRCAQSQDGCLHHVIR